jgi:hypothetical protein
MRNFREFLTDKMPVFLEDPLLCRALFGESVLNIFIHAHVAGAFERWVDIVATAYEESEKEAEKDVEWPLAVLLEGEENFRL